MLKLNNRFKILVGFIGVVLSCILSLYIYSVFYRYTYRSNNRIIETIKSEKHIENPKISVIIPVYNVEKFLRECLG